MFGYACVPTTQTKTLLDKCLQCRWLEAHQTSRRLEGLPPALGFAVPRQLAERRPVRRGPRLAPFWSETEEHFSSGESHAQPETPEADN